MSKLLQLLLFVGAAFVAGFSPPTAQAQSAKAPDVYSVTQVNSMMGPVATIKIDRDGSKAMMEQSLTPQSADAKPSHTKSYYDLTSHKTFSWDLNYATANCSGGTFSGDWGDPFEMSVGLMQDFNKQNPKQTGMETVNGFPTKVMGAVSNGEKTKVWLDTKYGLIIKAQSGGQILMEIKTLSLNKPPASLFALPAACSTTEPTEDERFSKEMGGEPGDFVNAIRPPASPNSCTVLLRVLRAGIMQPITSGFQIAIDTKVDPNNRPNYTTETSTGRARFGGGALHEVTGQLRNGVLRIENAPAQFDIEMYWGEGGYASTMIYRNCVSPQTVLLMVVKDPAKLGLGADWLWVKSGKFASGN